MTTTQRFVFGTHAANRELAEAAGYRVGPDPDQPGFFQWTREENGRVVEGCDASTASETQAWQEVIDIALNNSIEDSGVFASEWEQMSQERKMDLVKFSYFGF